MMFSSWFWEPAMRSMRICSVILTWKYHGQGIRATSIYSEAMSHKIYAACDAFLMPSLFEPCGLSQLMSLRYGTVPIVRETGGLKDTVDALQRIRGNGNRIQLRELQRP